MALKDFAKEYGVFILITLAMLILLPSYMISFFGPLFGTYATYATTAIILGFALWINKKVQKKI